MGIKSYMLRAIALLVCCSLPVIANAGALDVVWTFGTGNAPNTIPTVPTGTGTTGAGSTTNTNIVPVGVLPSKTLNAVVNVIQTSTELNAVGGTATVSVDSAKDKKDSGKAKSGSQGRAALGFEAYMSENQQIYAIPFSYAITPDLQADITIPFVSAKHQLLDEKNNKINWSDYEHGLGDVAASLKYIYNTSGDLESVSLFTLKFATGDEKLSLGTGSYDITLTQKLVKNYKLFRVAGMLGFTQPLNEPTLPDILDIRKHTKYDNGTTDLFSQYAAGNSKVRYGSSVTYMAAGESNMFYDPLWFGLKLSGIHAFEGSRHWNVADTDKYGWAVRDAKSPQSFTDVTVTTLDLTPQVKYFVSSNFGVTASVIIPLVSQNGGENSQRDVVFNFGIAKVF